MAARFILLLAFALVASSAPAHALPLDGEAAQGPGTDATDWGAYRFVCEGDGVGVSVVDVLEATGEHDAFLRLFRRYDPEGFAILADPALADKTVWAPTDTAISAVADQIASLSDDEVKAVLGYHVTPPRRTPEGPYPIVTPRFLADEGDLVHQTRTGILTGSDQRIRTTAGDGVLAVEDATILPTAWCTQAGSVFSIDRVITDAEPVPLIERAIYLVVFRYPVLPVIALAAVLVGIAFLLRTWARRHRVRG